MKGNTEGAHFYRSDVAVGSRFTSHHQCQSTPQPRVQTQFSYRRCYFHFTRAIWRHALRLAILYKQTDDDLDLSTPSLFGVKYSHPDPGTLWIAGPARRNTFIRGLSYILLHVNKTQVNKTHVNKTQLQITFNDCQFVNCLSGILLKVVHLEFVYLELTFFSDRPFGIRLSGNKPHGTPWTAGPGWLFPSHVARRIPA